MDSTAINFVLEHVFLPPKLPQQHHNEAGAEQLLKEVAQAARQFARSFPSDSSERKVWTQLTQSISKWIDVYDNGTPCTSKITHSLATMRKDDVLLFYLEPQNAAIVVRNKSRGAVFECFEVLSKTEAALAAKDALVRHFPARAVFVPDEKLKNSSYTEQLGDAIHKLSIEQLKIAMETTRKASNTVVEERQSAHPRAVTEWLFGVLGSCGQVVTSQVFCKRIHDDVCWKDTSLPWRRSGVWLSARVALQIALMNAELEGEGLLHYKNFMLFLISRLARNIAVAKQVPDILHLLRAKLARRNAKVGSSTFTFVQKTVDEVLRGIDKSMQHQWTEVIQRDDITVPPVPLDVLSTELLLNKSHSVLRSVWDRSRKSFTYSFTSYTPPLSARVILPKESLPEPGIFNCTGDILFCLVEFEFWVEEKLNNWLAANRTDESACHGLLELMRNYYAVAKPKYQSDPERTSIMLLVMFELWVALDIIAATVHPMLLSYPPEIPSSLFAPLLLGQRADLERLSRLELHIKSREARYTTNNPSLFSNPTSECFAVNFYNTSLALHLLRFRVEQQSQQARESKSREWEQMKAQYDQLMRESDSIKECGIFIFKGIDRNTGKYVVGRPRHDKKCQKCAKKQEAEALKISKHEWALPKDEILCKAVVFELGAPPSIVSWRDATFFLVQDVCRGRAIESQPTKQNLLSYPPLETHVQQYKQRRITLGSSAKPMLQSHYIKSSLNVDPILVNNGLVPRMNDTSNPQVWTAEQTEKPSLQRYCNASMSTVAKELGRYVNFTTHTTNFVIARQSTCPPEMGSHEAVLFGSLRSGERLQMLNVLGALMSPEIDMNSAATASLFRHAISQVGMASTTAPLYLRESQSVLEGEQFSWSLLNALETSFTKIAANFKEVSAAAVLLRVTLKVLSLTSFPEISTRCMTLVVQIRQAALTWIRQMSQLRTDQKNAHVDSGVLRDLSRQIQTACLLCRRTYALDNVAQKSMFYDPDAVTDYVEASVHLHTHRNSFSDTINSEPSAELLSDAYLAIGLERLLQVDLLRNDSAISDGIKKFWRTANFTECWRIVDANDSSWIENQASSKVVHYNLVTGSLLVSGRAISQLPAQYTADPLYRSIFGELELDVFAADVDDMEYMSKDEFQGHRIYFGLRRKMLLVRSSKNEETCEAVHRDWFLGDLPRTIVANSTPWISLKDGKVFFRARDRPFCSEPTDWTLCPGLDSISTKSMSVREKSLIDKNSQLGALISNILQPIEQPDHLIITTDKDSNVEVGLPRYHLHFDVDQKGRLVCRELSAFIDFNQQLGTLHGLQSRLVLRANSEVAGSDLRTVLIPNGKVKITSAAPHVRVEVQLGDSGSLTLSHFRLDARLGQLVSQDMEAHLYKAYMHAITSFPEADTLTGRTGTEESLLALSDPICLTCLPLSARAQDILRLISLLTPMRKFYPVHLKTMQTVAFLDNVPVMAQRDIFFGTANEIVAHNLRASCLFNTEVAPLSYHGDLGLLERSHNRTRKLYPSESVASTYRFVADGVYASRDQDSGDALLVSSTMAVLVESWPPTFRVMPSLKTMISGWKKVSGFHEAINFNSFSSLLGQDLKSVFPPLMNLCRSSSTSRESLVFIFSLIAYGDPRIAVKLKPLLAFAISPALRVLPGLEHNEYDLTEGHSVNRKEITTLLSQCQKPFVPSEAQSDSESDDISPEQQRFEEELGEQRQLILEAVNSSWPGDKVQLSLSRKKLCHYNLAEVKTLLNGRFATWYKNHVLLQQLEAYDQILESINCHWTGSEVLDLTQDFEAVSPEIRPATHFSLLDQMNMTAVTSHDFGGSKPTCLDQDLSQSLSRKGRLRLLDSNQASRSLEELEDIVADLRDDLAESVRGYGKLLGDSIEASRAILGQEQAKMEVPAEDVLVSKLQDSKHHIAYIMAQTRHLLRPPLPSQQGLVMARLWPQVSELTLLQLLSVELRDKVPFPWKPILFQFAKEITAAQRIERLQKFLASGDTFALNNELANPAHSKWIQEHRPDWLLLECQNNMLIRPVQIRVAKELLKPQNGAVLLGMGEGKTSIILPMVAAALADGSDLVRVVVLKPLAQEMLRILSLSFAGLVGRRLYYLPFSRQTALDHETPHRLRNLYEECREKKGILLTLPEYLNSFRLVGIDKLAPDTPELATDLIGVQSWLDLNSRDILDESDELARPSYELVYTNGEANLLSGAPERWNVSLEILALVRQNAATLHDKFPTMFEVEARGHGSFPHVRVLNESGAKILAKLVTQAIVHGHVPTLSLGHCNVEILQAVGDFILNINVESSQFDLLKEHFQGSAKLDLLYVARGLISHQILSHTLCKRWLVNYGLDRSRTMSAVPYRAKAVPSPSAEFAQPEGSIVLTALSFYYTGLLRSDLRRCLLILMRLPDPTDAYGEWVKHSTLPEKYHKANSINLDDAYCIDELYTHLKQNSELINFFLRHVVYPSQAKEFRYKLSTSAWDLCQSGKVLTAGFSGTCDSRIPIVQKDLPDLQHIPATTLITLLRWENRQYFCAKSPSGGRLSTNNLLQRIITDGPVDVCIDVGAQMLEGNHEIAHMWLQLSPKEKIAAIYFSESDQKMVLNRNGATELLASSIFKDQLGSCLIFLDEFHTRGTDFQLPDNFVAAVLLGPGILKDNLAQACMRMRKLAVSQRVRFYAPPEVDQAIRSIMKDESEELSSLHVVQWAINQSCRTLRKQGPLYATRGLLHSRRRLAAEHHVSPDGDIANAERYLNTIRERECRPVSELYRVERRQHAEMPFKPTFEEARDAVFKELVVEFERTNTADCHEGGITQEQEREILHEVEEERELQRPREVEALKPEFSRALWDHIRNGTSLIGTPDLRPCFEILEQTRIEFHYKQKDFPNHVVVTRDFMRTIKSASGSPEDDFLKPVQWVVKTRGIQQPIIISPYEAHFFFPLFLKSKTSTLYLYQARTSRDMVPFDGFDICKFPEKNDSRDIQPIAIAVLNLFAGQLYFSSFEHYQQLCTVIGLFDGERPLPLKRKVADDNFVSPACRVANGWTECTFKTSPVSWIKSFIDIRRLGIEWSHTHLGRIVSGRILRRSDFVDVVDGGDEAILAEDMADLEIDEKEIPVKVEHETDQ